MFTRKRILEATWLIIIIALFVISIQAVRNGYFIDKIDSFGIWAPVIFVLLKISTLVFAPLGGMPLYFIAGGLFGKLTGFLLAMLGDTLGSIICFLLSRYYGEKVVKVFAGENIFKKIVSTVAVLKDKKSFIKARISMMIMPEILSYASGFSRIKFSTFFIINFLLYLPADFIFVFFGYEVITLMANHGLILYGVILLITGVGFWLLYKDYKKLGNIEGM